MSAARPTEPSMRVGLATILAGILASGPLGCNSPSSTIVTDCPPVVQCAAACGSGCFSGCGKRGAAGCCNTVHTCTTTCTTSCTTACTTAACTTTDCTTASCTTRTTSCATQPTCNAPKVCSPATTRDCTAVEGASIAVCVRGTRTCLPDGTGFGPCVGDQPASPNSCDAATSWSCGAPPACGTPLTTTAIGGDGDESIDSIAAMPDGSTIVALSLDHAQVQLGGVTATDGVVVANLDPTGGVVWALPLAEATQVMVAASAAGDVFVVGRFKGTLAVGDDHPLIATSTSLGFAARLSPAGVVSWARKLGDTQLLPTALVLTSTGDPVVAGERAVAASIDGLGIASSQPGGGFALFLDGETGAATQLQSVGAGPNDLHALGADLVRGVALVNDNLAVVATSMPSHIHCGRDLELSFVDRHVSSRVAQELNPSEPLDPSAIAVDAWGRILVTGTPSTTFTMSTHPVLPGALLVLDALGGAEIDLVELPGPGTAIVPTPSGFYVAGTVLTTAASTAFLAKYDLDLHRYFERAFTLTGGGPAPPTAFITSLAAVPAGVAMGGNLRGTVDFGFEFIAKPLSSSSGADAFVAVLAP